MKNDVMPSVVQMAKEELQQLTAEVKETIANGIELPTAKQRTFSTMDNWKILQSSRSATERFRRN